MMKIKCFDVAMMVIDDHNQKLTGQYTTDETALREIEQSCTYIDKLAEDFEGESVRVEINEDNNICITLVCYDIEASDISDPLMMLLLKAIAFSVKQDEEDKLSVTFTYKSIWKKSQVEENE